jgi:hypothetical protein
MWYELRIEAHAEGVLMSTPSIAPKIVLCRDPAAAARPTRQASSSGGKGGKNEPPAPGLEPPPGWSKKPSLHEEARYEVDRQGTVKVITTAELEAISAAIRAADAAEAEVLAAASAPPQPGEEGADGADAAAPSAPAGDGNTALPAKVGWL